MNAGRPPSLLDDMLERERVANRRKHWVRAVTACNSRCVFCLDMDTPRNVYLPEAEIQAEIARGRDEFDADKLILSGGEATLHPAFPALVRYARDLGYDRVQTVTNGYRMGDRAFLAECLDAGLGEITFSLHGHNAELHDRLTRTPGAFDRIVRAMVRAVRDGRPIVNADVVINKQNVAVLDRIIELCLSLGVSEFDLLHVIPQAEAFRQRDDLFYDPREHLPLLHKVFRLNRHPRVTIWTNRFPVSFLEGMEDLIQDPHKMLDEVNGRRFQVRRYLDEGDPLDCRQPERCVHCFIEPFCTTMDRVIEGQRAQTWDVWWVGRDACHKGVTLPFGCRMVGLELPEMAGLDRVEVPEGAGVYARVGDTGPIPEDGPRPLVLVAETAAQLDAWLGQGTPPTGVEIEVHLNQDTGSWLLAHRDAVAAALPKVRIRQPGHEHLAEAAASDVRDPGALFAALDLPVRVSGLPACQTPGATLDPGLAVLEAALFDRDSGRLSIRALSRWHIREGYKGKSVRCADCRLNSRCDGLPINLIRDQGLKMARPLTDGAWADAADRQLRARHPDPLPRLENGRPPEPVAPSLPGHAPPSAAPLDPLAVVAARLAARRAARRAAREAASRDP